MVRVWDVFVRFSHWTVALAFFVAYLLEDGFLTLHVWAGYLVGVLVVLRVLWAFVGPRHARLADLVYGPRAIGAYLVDLVTFRAKRYLGHSPAGGAMVLALWLGLLATVWTGLELYAVEEGRGPLAAAPSEQGRRPAPRSSLLVLASEQERGEDRSGERDSLWEGLHEIAADLVLFLVILHIAGVTLASIVHRENLPRSMVNGMKRADLHEIK